MKRVEKRYRRLRSEGFPRFEAKRIAEATEYRLDHPALRVLRKERRRGLREAKQAGLGRASINREISFRYRVEEYIDKKGRYQPLRRLRVISEEPQVKKFIRLVRVQRETEAGSEGRYTILRRSGFRPWEARLLANMKDIDPSQRRHTFLSKPWQAMIKNHRAYVDRMLVKAGARVRKEMGNRRWNQLTKAQQRRLAAQKLDDMLRRLFASGKYSPFDFLKLEYRPKPKPRGYNPAPRQRAVKRIDKLMSTKKQAVLFFD